MKASGSRSARMATYSAVHGPMPGSAHQGAPELGRVGAGVDHDVPVGDGLGQGHEGAPPAGRHGEGAGIALGQRDERARAWGRGG